MNTADKILQARNALHLCESLLLEAYINAPAAVATGIKNALVSLANHRETLASLHQLANQLTEPERPRKRLLRASELLDS